MSAEIPQQEVELTEFEQRLLDGEIDEEELFRARFGQGLPLGATPNEALDDKES